MRDRDLQAYGRRIGYEGPWEPTRAVLDALSLHQVTAVPFENTWPVLKKPVRLEVEALVDKIVYQGRGGYCFELNGLLLAVLEKVGFQVTPLRGGVRLHVEGRDEAVGHTHLALLVTLEEGRVFADLGVGALSLSAALDWDGVGAQETPHDRRRFEDAGGQRYHQVWREGRWLDIAEFGGERMDETDREIASWYTSTHPESRFTQQLMMARAMRDGRRAGLRYEDGAFVLSVRGRDGEGTVTRVEGAKHLQEVARRCFGLEMGRDEARQYFGR